MNLRKIIRESIESLVNQEVNELDIPELDSFKFVDKKKDDKENDVWKYSLQEENYTINFFIAKNKNNKWFYKVFVYWKALSKSLTSGRGKDFEIKFGPFENFEELKKSIHEAVNNNVLFSFQNYHDNNKTQLNDEIFRVIEKLKNHKEDIENNTGSYFKDLKKILPNFLKSKEEIKKYLDAEYPDEEDKQFLLLTLQKMDHIKLHNQINSIKSIF
jgi:predicted nucleotide-binding protein (sugar kinase/HSP70/actin superfamily)